jgi:hypothetical protein
MSIEISNIARNHWKTEAVQPGSGSQRTKGDKPRDSGSTAVDTREDTVEIGNSLRGLIESNQASGETRIEDLKEAERRLGEITSLITSENGQSLGEQAYNLNRQNAVRLLI